ncbi:MAG: hypothetical protein M1819_000802 [Sarea resinae]|nr:MAG: hypothetical protein M1819_000802 [Sarea resinae]
MPTQGGWINTPALAAWYDRVLVDNREDTTYGLWTTLFARQFPSDQWIITPQRSQQPGSASERPDLVVERLYGGGTFVQVVVLEAKPERQTAAQDFMADQQVLRYAVLALQGGARHGQEWVFAARAVGTKIMVYRVNKDNRVLEPVASDFMDPKRHAQALDQVFNRIRTQDIFEP